MKICTVQGCNGKHYSKGLCQKHYRQMKRGTIVQESSTDIVQDNTEQNIVQDSTGNIVQEVVLYSTVDVSTDNTDIVQEHIVQPSTTKPKLPKIPKPVKKPTKKLSDEELYKKLILDSFPNLLEDDSESLEEHYYKHHNTSWLFANGIDRDEFITWQIKTCDGMLRDKMPFPQVKCSTNIRIAKESN